MLFLKLFITITLTGIVNSYCFNITWNYILSTTREFSCSTEKFLNAGQFMNGLILHGGELNHTVGVICCVIDTNLIPKIVIYNDWQAFNRWEDQVKCPVGYFLESIQSISKSDHYNKANIARCAKFPAHPFYFTKCHVAWRRDGIVSCREDYFVNGLMRNSKNEGYLSLGLYCCKMSEKRDIYGTEELKTKIMEITLVRLAKLAHSFGYVLTGGNGTTLVGEGFYRSQDSWLTHKTSIYRFAIDYFGWSLAVKEIKYGEILIDDLKPEAIHTGTEYNNLDTSSIKTFEFSKIVQDTTTHSAASSWKNSHELSLSIDFSTKFLGDITASLTASLEYSSSKIEEKQNINSAKFVVTTTHEIPPNSAAKYSVIVSKSRTTVPYTAILIAKFNVRFRGFLNRQSNPDFPNDNYHYKHKNDRDTNPVNFTYTFGDTSEPFYAFLRRQNITKAKPWLWNELIKDQPFSFEMIESLTNENQYQFTLRGKLDRVAGSKVDVVWNDVRLKRRSVSGESRSETTCPTGIFIAQAGPNDKSVEVEYPNVVWEEGNFSSFEPVQYREAT